MFMRKMAFVLPGLLWALTERVAAHERWLLTPQQIAELSAQGRPELFTNWWPGLAIAGLIILAFFALALVEYRHRDLQARLARPLSDLAANWGALAVRAGLAVMLASASFGLLPRHGYGLGAQPTLLVPDLQLALLGQDWMWLTIPQAILAVLLALGAATRLAGVGVVALSVLGFVLFKGHFLSYGLHFAAPGLFLLVFGGGRFSLDALACDTDSTYLSGANRWLNHYQPRIYPLILFMMGITFAYLGANFKLAQPTLLIEILEHGGFPTLGLPTELVALMMTVIEITAGVLLALGLLVRPIALFLIGAFTLFAITLGESVFFHANLYGMMIIFALAGRTAPRIGHDRASDVPAPAMAAIPSAQA